MVVFIDKLDRYKYCSIFNRIADISKYDNFVKGQDSSPMKALFDMEKYEHILRNMLNSDESFDEEIF